MHVVSLNIGGPQDFVRNGRTLKSSINRQPVTQPVFLTPLGFEGDQATNKRHHGGPDKAVCCYPIEHYPHWRERLNTALDVPAFGENLTTQALLENEVCLGDCLRIGEALTQVSQPRQPCGTLAARNHCPDFPKWINDAGTTGFYLRVLQPGRVRVGDRIELIERPHPHVTIESLLRVMLNKDAPAEQLEGLIALPTLSESWRTTFRQRLPGAPLEPA